jgi:hypothetical protein
MAKLQTWADEGFGVIERALSLEKRIEDRAIA